MNKRKKNQTWNAREIRRNYYADSAHRYNEMHVNEQDSHFFALSFMLSTLDSFKIESILDIGSGTGRTLTYIKEKYPNMSIIGFEPVKELREVGYSQGISRDDSVEGDATELEFADRSFDLVLPQINTVTYRGRRGARSARREEGEYSIVFNRRATQQTGMHRRPNATVFM